MSLLFLQDQFYNNRVVMMTDGSYANGACSGDAMPIVHDNSVYSPTGAITECGMSLAAWQVDVPCRVCVFCRKFARVVVLTVSRLCPWWW